MFFIPEQKIPNPPGFCFFKLLQNDFWWWDISHCFSCGGIEAFLDFVDDDVPFHLTHTEGKGPAAGSTSWQTFSRTRSHHGHEKLQPILKKRKYLWTMRMWLWWEMSKLTNLQIVRIGIRTFQTYSYKLLEVGTIVTCKLFLQCLHFLFEQEPISRNTLQARVPCAYRAPIGWVIEGFQETSHNQQTALQWNNWHSVQWKHRNRLYTMTTRKRVIGNLISHMYSCLIYRYIISCIYIYIYIYIYAYTCVV